MDNKTFKFLLEIARASHIFTVLTAVAVFNLFDSVGNSLRENFKLEEEDIHKPR